MPRAWKYKKRTWDEARAGGLAMHGKGKSWYSANFSCRACFEGCFEFLRFIAMGRGGRERSRFRGGRGRTAKIPSWSASLIMSWSSASEGFWPSERMTVASSLCVMVPSPSLSNIEKASLNSVEGQTGENGGERRTRESKVNK